MVAGVGMDSFFSQVQVTLSENGLLAYVPGGDGAMGKLAWVDRRGRTEFFPVPERLYGVIDLAPGGTSLAAHVSDVNDSIWMLRHPSSGRTEAGDDREGWLARLDARRQDDLLCLMAAGRGEEHS